VHVLDGNVVANGEVGISGSRSSPNPMSPIIGTSERARRQQPVNYGIVVNNFNFKFYPDGIYLVILRVYRYGIQSGQKIPVRDTQRTEKTGNKNFLPAICIP
jgi:hypothetical protein